MTIIADAIIEIQNLGLDKIRCYLTGAPYATLDPNEIAFALESELAEDPMISQGRLVDMWELKAVTFNSQLLPTLRGIKTKSLLSFMSSGHNGQVKALTYLLTRLFFPHLGSEPLRSDIAKERMLFSTHLHDTAAKWDAFKVAGFVQQLVVIDSYCSMPHWHTLWAFESSVSKLGIDKAPLKVRETFADPSLIAEDESRIEAVVTYLYELMLYVTERDGVAGKAGNRFSQEIMLIQAAHLPQPVIPHFQKKLSEADLLRQQDRRAINSRTELRVAHSAIHGKGTPLNYHTDEIFQAAKSIRMNTKKAAESKAKGEPKPKKAPKIDSKFMAAFAAVAKKFGE